MWALNKNPADRPHDADEFIAALEAAKSAIRAGVARRADRLDGGAGGRRRCRSPPAGLAGAQGVNVAADTPAPPPPLSVYPAIPYDAGAAGSPPDEQQADRGSVAVDRAAARVAAGRGGGRVPAHAVGAGDGPDVVDNQPPVARARFSRTRASTSASPQQPSTQTTQTRDRRDPRRRHQGRQGIDGRADGLLGPGNVTVPPVRRRARSPRRRHAIGKVGLKVGRADHRVRATRSAAVSVIDTDPPAGTAVPAGSASTLFVSSGRAEGRGAGRDRPDREQRGEATLQAAGFAVDRRPCSDDQRAGGQRDQPEPERRHGGSRRARAVDLVVAQAPTTANVPNVNGQTAAAATSALQGAGFKVAQTTKNVTNKSQDGVVLSQSPSGGHERQEGQHRDDRRRPLLRSHADHADHDRDHDRPRPRRPRTTRPTP